jgi:hypothetical protein
MINKRTAFATVLPVVMKGHEDTSATLRILKKYENIDRKHTRESHAPGTLSSDA